MRHNEHYTDYNHIRVYGMIKGYSDSHIAGQQKLAYMVNAPYDTVELDDGKIIRFYDLTSEARKEFANVR